MMILYFRNVWKTYFMEPKAKGYTHTQKLLWEHTLLILLIITCSLKYIYTKEITTNKWEHQSPFRNYFLVGSERQGQVIRTLEERPWNCRSLRKAPSLNAIRASGIGIHNSGDNGSFWLLTVLEELGDGAPWIKDSGICGGAASSERMLQGRGEVIWKHCNQWLLLEGTAASGSQKCSWDGWRLLTGTGGKQERVPVFSF